MGLIDMFDNLQNLVQMKEQLMQNPMAFLAKRNYNIPQGMTNPNDILQHLLNTGQIRQEQVNAAMNERNNPIIQKLFGGR